MLEAIDYFTIQNLYARYNLCSDAGDAEGYADCFTTDGELRVMPRGLVVKGRANLVTYKIADKASRADLYRRHVNGSLHLEPLGAGGVRGRCYLQAFNGTPGELPYQTVCGVYTDTILKEDGQWRFSVRDLLVDGSRK